MPPDDGTAGSDGSLPPPPVEDAGTAPAEAPGASDPAPDPAPAPSSTGVPESAGSTEAAPGSVAPSPAGSAPEPTIIVLPTVYVTSTIPVQAVAYDWTLFAGIGAAAILLSAGVAAFKKMTSKGAPPESGDPCSAIKSERDEKNRERKETKNAISLQESIIETLRKKLEDEATDVVKEKAKDALVGKKGTKRERVDTAHEAYETYEDATEALEKAEQLLAALREKQAVLTKEADVLETSYALCIGDLARVAPISGAGTALPTALPGGKNALILHGTDASSKSNWFPWLSEELKGRGWRVWVPDLPEAKRPSIKRYTDFIFDSSWKFDEHSVIIGHSSGAVAALGLLEALPEDTSIDTAILVGAFKSDLGWESLKDFFDGPLDFEKIRTRTKRFILIHSDDDPYCPLSHAEYLAEKLGGELIVKPGQKHFSVGTAGEAYRKFPLLLDLLEGPKSEAK